MDEYVREFVQESEENITELNNALLAFERNPDDDEAMEQIFRTAHTLKGNCGAMGFADASDLAHAIEDLLDAVRSGDLEVSPELMDHVFDGVDALEAMIDEVPEHGEPRTDPSETIENLRDQLSAAEGLAEPSDREIEALLEAAADPEDDSHNLFHVRLGVSEELESRGMLVVEALEDAFDLLGTAPEEAAIEAGDYGGHFDAVFASAVGERSIAAALDPVDVVEDAIIAEVTDRVDDVEESDDSTVDDAGPAEDVDPDDMEVDDLLDEFSEYDDLDEMVEQVDDVEGFEDLGDAGSFDDIEVGDVGVDAPSPDEVEVDADDEGDDEPAPDEEPEDASETFQELKQEVDPVGFDELQDELSDLEFEEYDDDEVGFDELLDEDELAGDDPFASGEVSGDPFGAGDGTDEPSVDELLSDDDTTDEATVDDTTSVADDVLDEVEADATADAGEDPAVDVEDDTPADDVLDAVGADAATHDQSGDDAVAGDAVPDDQSDDATTDDADDESIVDGVLDEALGDAEADSSSVDAEADDALGDAESDDALGDAEFDEAFGDAESDEAFGESDDVLGDTESDDSLGDAGSDDALTGSTDDAVTAAADDAADDAEPEDGPELELDEPFGDAEGDSAEPSASSEEQADRDVEVSEAGAFDDFGLDESADAASADDELDLSVGLDDEAADDESADDGPASADDAAVETTSFDATEPAETPADDAGGDVETTSFDGVDDDTASLDADTSSFGDDTSSLDSGLGDDTASLDAGSGTQSASGSGSQAQQADAAEESAEELDAAVKSALAAAGVSIDLGGGSSEDDSAELSAAAGTGVSADEIQSIRVDVDQVDDLMNLVEELVTTRARLRRAVEGGEPRTVIEGEVDELEAITSEIQDTVMDVRLVPLQTVANKLPRLVRDLSREQDKQVALEMEGEDVELDRSILNQIGDPLMHLVRNAIDHGIEPPEEREDAGKDPEGTIELRARRERDEVVIEIDDDGRGLDVDAIREEAAEEGIHSYEELREMDDEEVYDLVFHSGFSTSGEVTDVSGRGVGMDVVARTVEDLDGTVTVDSEPGEGTTVRLRVPISVAIADVLFVEAGGEEYGIPIKVVKEIGPSGSVTTEDGREVIERGEESYPLVRLSEALETPRTGRNGEGMLVQIRDDVRPVALHCDRIRGQQEVVVKPFEGFLGDIPGLSGATVLGEGDVVNILDVETL